MKTGTTDSCTRHETTELTDLNSDSADLHQKSSCTNEHTDTTGRYEVYHSSCVPYVIMSADAKRLCILIHLSYFIFLSAETIQGAQLPQRNSK